MLLNLMYIKKCWVPSKVMIQNESDNYDNQNKTKHFEW